MKRQSQQGIALVITLIMLAVVTVMAVIFLGVSRRERVSLGVTAQLTDARLAADAAVARAQAETVARIAARSNRLAYEFVVSTNYINAAGFQPGVSGPLNVSYTYASGAPITGNDLLQNLTNLFLDPRPPVFVRDPVTGTNDFRYYLDINRNGRFETNGLQPVRVAGALAGTNSYVGDPEWIGVLEHPDRPHSSSNRFVARYAYVALPAGKSLDVNFIHNRAKRVGAGEGYTRNQGVGAWELNLAAFLGTLLPQTYLNQYAFQPETVGPNGGLTFRDALGLFRARMGMTNIFQPLPLYTVQQYFGAVGAQVFRNDFVDGYSDDVLSGGVPTVPENDDPNRPWPGSEPTNNAGFFNYQEFWDPVKTAMDPGVPGDSFSARLLLASLDINNTENQFAFTRLLSQMGTDSLPANRDRIHLNFTNACWVAPHYAGGMWQAGASNGTPRITRGAEVFMVPWASTRQTRQDFVMLVADQLLRQTYGSGLSDGIPVYPTNLYSSGVHRCVQVAVNMLDLQVTNNRVVVGARPLDLPSVFRPVFAVRNVSGTNQVHIIGYEEVLNDLPLQLRWRNPAVAGDMSALQTGDNVYGVPWVLGARKGWPNFNEFQMDTSMLVTRRLQGLKDPATKRVTFQQSYEITVSNLFGVETWNAYTQAFGGSLELRYTNLCSLVLRDNLLDRTGVSAAGVVRSNLVAVGAAALVTNWVGREFRALTNRFAFVPNSDYFPGRGTNSLQPPSPGISFDGTIGFPTPDWRLQVTNRLMLSLVYDAGALGRRVVDMVTLDPLPAGFDVSRHLVGETNAFSDAGRRDGSFWLTNRLGGLASAPTWGITNQLFVSTNDVLARTDWGSWTEDPISGRQKERAIDEFRMFMGLPPLFDSRRTNTPALVVQVPFTATRRLLQQLSWMANDPLVHQHLEDLYDPVYSSTNNVVAVRPGGTGEGYTLGLPNLGQLNLRYRPWGGRPGKDTSNDRWAYNPAVKDPAVAQADDWDFPTNLLANVGGLGRVHRGTPWQTLYLKSGMEPPVEWQRWAGRSETHPTNDWRLLDVFTTALSDNAARGLLSVNQTNLPAWAAVLSGVTVQSNTARGLRPSLAPQADHLYVDPFSAQLRYIVTSINTNRLARRGQTYDYLGEILSAPALSDLSPYLNLAGLTGGQARITDAMYERIPQQILGLLKADEPYVVVYAYGQSLRPAERSLVMRAGTPYFNLCTNYQIAGEVLTKTAFRIVERRQGTNLFYDSVVESYNVMPVD